MISDYGYAYGVFSDPVVLPFGILTNTAGPMVGMNYLANTVFVTNPGTYLISYSLVYTSADSTSMVLGTTLRLLIPEGRVPLVNTGGVTSGQIMLTLEAGEGVFLANDTTGEIQVPIAPAPLVAARLTLLKLE